MVLTHDEILFKFLGTRARRFVQRVQSEWAYYRSPMIQAREGCLVRDEIRSRLTRLAYHRYEKTLPTKLLTTTQN